MARKMSKMRRKVKLELGKYKRGSLHSGSKTGPRVTSRSQAIAIALSVGRKAAHKRRRK